MLYQLPILDVFLTAICIVYFFRKTTSSLCDIDICVIILSILFFFAFLRNITLGSFSILLKIESGFLLYFLGRKYYSSPNTILTALKNSFIIVLIISIFSYISGTGFQQWGAYKTFTGYYYFKTDMAVALAQGFIVFAFGYTLKIKKYIILLICFFMVFLTNARMYYFIFIIILFLVYLYHKNIKTGKQIKINLKIFAICILIVISLLFLLNYWGKTFLGERYLLFEFENLTDLASESNTQGRSVIWYCIYEYFAKQDLLTRLWGIDLISDSLSNPMGHNSHNMYLKILFSTGYIGSIIYILFIGYIIKYLNKTRNIRLFYLTCGFLSIYFLSGISYITIESTQLTWLPMFFIGNCVSEVKVKNRFNNQLIKQTI